MALGSSEKAVEIEVGVWLVFRGWGGGDAHAAGPTKTSEQRHPLVSN